MIGQKLLISEIGKQINNNTFPRFSIITGDGERNEVVKYIADSLNAIYVEIPDCKVDTIRTIIFNSYKVESVTVYNIQDADSMSMQAKNALLKVTEEPPNKAYFVMTLDDLNNTLPTIKSRGMIFQLEPYSRKELEQYCNDENVLKLAETPNDVDILKSYEAEQFYGFVSKVANNIATASGSNALKISQSIKMKDTEEAGYDLRMFWKAFCLVCMDNRWFKGLRLTSSYSSRLKTKSINRAMLFDAWIFDIREEWIDGNC